MTEKRFTQKDEDDWEILDRNKHFAYAHSSYQAKKIIQELNELVETNRELYKENKELKDKYNEQSVSYEGLEEQVERLLDFKDKVFNLINGKIKWYSHKPVSAPISQPMSVNFDADMDRLARLSELEALKEELTE